MKKYTTPEVEVIKFQIQEAIADTTIIEGEMGPGSVGEGGGARG